MLKMGPFHLIMNDISWSTRILHFNSSIIKHTLLTSHSPCSLYTMYSMNKTQGYHRFYMSLCRVYEVI